MAAPLIITVFGATGSQGGAVARTLATDSNIRVRAVTSDSSQPQQLAQNNGIEICRCNLNDVYSINAVLNGTDACLLVTYTDFKDPSCKENEIRQGRLIADACAMAGVKHVVFSTQLHAKRMLGIEVRHLDAKAEIEDYLYQKNIPLTCIMVPCFYEEFMGLFRPDQVDHHEYRLSLPIGQAPLDMISIDNIGDIVRKIFFNRDVYLNKTISVCGDKITIREIAQILTTHLKPKVFKEKQISVNDYKMLDFPGVRDWANMFYFFSRVDQRYNVASSRQINPRLLSFEDWVCQNRDLLHKTL
ncbi:nmrA-like family domain-containing protein 1 [Haliotis rubra]|uniref:nmrA-like family domain-containing protein 1 n=1 Tax=Haliotis rubra TaxID=36100 RepID=UPI001EE5F4DF|nr:nmrA-like family domain-containing protein 1 [Haliotis rubra]